MVYAKDFDTVKDFGSFGEHLSGGHVALASEVSVASVATYMENGIWAQKSSVWNRGVQVSMCFD